MEFADVLDNFLEGKYYTYSDYQADGSLSILLDRIKDHLMNNKAVPRIGITHHEALSLEHETVLLSFSRRQYNMIYEHKHKQKDLINCLRFGYNGSNSKRQGIKIIKADDEKKYVVDELINIYSEQIQDTYDIPLAQVTSLVPVKLQKKESPTFFGLFNNEKPYQIILLDHV